MTGECLLHLVPYLIPFVTTRVARGTTLNSGYHKYKCNITFGKYNKNFGKGEYNLNLIFKLKQLFEIYIRN